MNFLLNEQHIMRVSLISCRNLPILWQDRKLGVDCRMQRRINFLLYCPTHKECCYDVWSSHCNNIYCRTRIDELLPGLKGIPRSRSFFTSNNQIYQNFWKLCGYLWLLFPYFEWGVQIYLYNQSDCWEFLIVGFYQDICSLIYLSNPQWVSTCNILGHDYLEIMV